MIIGFPGNLGGPVVSILTAGRSTGLHNSRLIRGPRPRAERGRTGTQRWYRQAKETKCGETGGKESERLIVPASQGNHPRDPGEGRGRHLMNRWRETCQVRRDLIPCPRNDNGSRNSPGLPGHGLHEPGASHRPRMAAQSPCATRKDGAVGMDGQTADEYEVNLVANLQNLLDRAKSGTYVAPPVRRVHIPKAGSATETRPLGIPTYEDKILQRAVLMVLEPVYETDFLDVSHGFRRGRGAHGALASLWKPGDEAGMQLDRGRRSAKIFRHDRPWPSPGVPQASGARWCDPAIDRQMA